MNKTPKLYEGLTKLNKSETNKKWRDFGGNSQAVSVTDGSFITRTTDYASKNTGISLNLIETLRRNADGYGSISWRVEIGKVARRKPPKEKFNASWKPAILAKIRELVLNGGVTVASASKALAKELGVSYGTIRANLYAADKWARGESTSFLPHRSMIRPIFDLFCELGKKDMVLSGLSAYCSKVPKPSEQVTVILNEHKQ